MKPLFREPDKKIKLEKQQICELLLFCQRASNSGFTGINDYRRIQEKREEFMKFSLATFTEKVFKKSLSLVRELSTKRATIPVNYAEELTLLMMFNRVEASPYLQAIQAEITLQLKSINTYNEVYKRPAVVTI